MSYDKARKLTTLVVYIFGGMPRALNGFKHSLHHYVIASCHFVRICRNAEFIYHAIWSFFDGNESSDIVGMCNIIRLVRLYGAHNFLVVRNTFFRERLLQKDTNKTSLAHGPRAAVYEFVTCANVLLFCFQYFSLNTIQNDLL